MDAREQRGLVIASQSGIRQMGDAWIVPSQSGSGSYRVSLEAGELACSCPDFELRRSHCKHLYAAAFFLQRQTVTETKTPDGLTFTTTVTETAAAVRVSYPQPSWPKYNAAQCAEKAIAQTFLRSLCDGIVNAEPPRRGRPRTPLSDLVYAMAMKVYGTMSTRRTTTDLEASMEDAPRYNTIIENFDRADLTPVLTSLVEQSAAPLASVERDFAIDATGFSTTSYHRWFDHKYGKERKAHGWIKAHAVIGVATNVITAIKVTTQDAHDAPELPALVKSTAKHFELGHVTADKAYLSHNNLAVVEARGGVPVIPFKSNSRGSGSAAWRCAFALFMYKQDEFLNLYHQRSNIESTFSAMKRKFGAGVRSKNFTAQTNEVLCKALCFNLSMLVHAMFELGIDPTFEWGQQA